MIQFVSLGLAAIHLGDVVSLVSGVTTIFLVVLTYAAVRASRASAEAAADSARLAERQLQEAHRPLLLPADPSEEDGHLVIPVRNIGVGPALLIYGRAQTRNLPPNVVGRFPQSVLPGAPASGDAALRFNGAGVPLSNLLSLKVTYKDAAGRSYTTDAKWDHRLRTFTHVNVTEGDSARVPVKVSIGAPRSDNPT